MKMRQNKNKMASPKVPRGRIENTEAGSLDCSLCDGVIVDKNDNSILCDGLCNKWFHLECTGLSEDEFEIVSKPQCKLKWLCSVCVDELDKKIIKEKKDSAGWLFMLKENAKLHTENKDLNVELAILKVRVDLNIVHKDTSGEAVNPESLEEKKVVDKQVKKRYSDVILVKPVNNKNNINTRKVLMENVNPNKLKVNIVKVNEKEGGEIEILCHDKLSKDILLEKINHCSDQITAEHVAHKDKVKRVECVVFRNDNVLPDNDEFITDLINQNNIDHNEINIKIVKRKVIKNGTAEVIILDIDVKTYDWIMVKRNEKIYIHWQSVQVKNHVYIIQCFKCQNYGHYAKDCKSTKEYCRFCGGNHRSSLCKEFHFKSCINCEDKNKRFGCKLNTDHYADNRLCPVYIDIKKRVELKLLAQ